jgi:hypothetical protein
MNWHPIEPPGIGAATMATDLETNPFEFGGAGHVICCRCGQTVPREDAQFVMESAAGEKILFDPLVNSYACPPCFLRVRHEQHKRLRIGTWFTAVILGVCLVVFGASVWDSFKPTQEWFLSFFVREVLFGVFFTGFLVYLILWDRHPRRP